MTGKTEPRIWTPPLRELTEETSFGFDFIDFCDEIAPWVGPLLDPPVEDWQLDEWQRWLAIHMGELITIKTKRGPLVVPRFRIVLVMVARQNGKSVLCRLLTLYWMFIECHSTIYGINSTRDTAKKSWREVITLAEGIAPLAEELPSRHVNPVIGQEDFWNNQDSHYLFGAPNSRAGRSLTIARAIIDELRQHKNRDAWDALIPTMNAIKDAQAVIITNEGDETAIVLHELHEAALGYIETGEGDPRLGMFSWSSPAGAEPTDLEALAYSNPNLGDRIQADVLIGQAMQAKRAGGETLARFRVEMMCQRVATLDPAIEPEAWKRSGLDDDELINLADYRRRLALCYDVSLDGSHATLVGAATIEGITYVEVIAVWYGFGATKQLRTDLPDWAEKLRPRAIGWFPKGPSASVAADLKQRSGYRAWPPKRVTVEELTTETPAVCMGLAELVLADQLRHPRDEMLSTHVGQTQRLFRADDTWVFTRRGSKPIDATYALAGAVHLARTLPAPLAALEIA